ncbi:MAG: hypothetical protein ACXWDI_06445 [Nocardioides sp.]
MSEYDDHADSGRVPADGPARADQAWWQLTSLLTPAASAVAAFAVAATSLSGQNLLLIGVQSLLGQGFGSGGSPAGYYTVWGVAALVPLLLVVLLARVALRATSSGWESTLARASMLLAAAGAVGAVLTALGGILHDGLL